MKRITIGSVVSTDFSRFLARCDLNRASIVGAKPSASAAQDYVTGEEPDQDQPADCQPERVRSISNAARERRRRTVHGCDAWPARNLE
jgi:hypothetical protein